MLPKLPAVGAEGRALERRAGLVIVAKAGKEAPRGWKRGVAVLIP